MKHHTTIFLLSLLMMPLIAGGQVDEVPGLIEKITDGDTVWVDPDDGRPATTPADRLKVRMIEMDAPETHLPTPSSGVVGQGHWGDTATEVLAELVPKGTRVKLDDHGLDKYKRTLGVVFHKGNDVNMEMVRLGWAVTYIICEGKECYPSFFKTHRVKEYIDACEEAKGNGRGIWDPRDPLEEMPFEFRIRMQEREFEKFVGNYKTREYYDPSDYQEVPECQRIFFMRESEAKRVGFVKRGKSRFDLPLLSSVHFK